MEKYFNVKLEFDRNKVDKIIEDTILNGGKGYVCSVEGNIITTANSDEKYLSVVNDALVNICDGSSIAFLASAIHRKKFRTYIGADLFIDYIKLSRYKSFFIGNTNEVLDGLKDNLSKFDSKIKNMRFETLPFKSVEDFDYKAIAQMINEDNPDIIWVSLGAPKQEVFMSKLLPFLNRGIMFGFGAIFNFYSSKSDERRAPKILLKLKMEWVYRLVLNPKRIGKRVFNYFNIMPKVIFNEIFNKYSTK